MSEEKTTGGADGGEKKTPAIHSEHASLVIAVTKGLAGASDEDEFARRLAALRRAAGHAE